MPNSKEASCFAPPPGRASSSSDDSSASDSARDQSSEFERTRAARVAADVGSDCCNCRRWKGFVDTSAAGVETAGATFSLPWAIFFKNGFLDSSDGGLVMTGIAERGGLGSDMVGGNGGATGGAEGISLVNSWLSVGVMASGPSSSDELSSPRFSNCN